MQKNVASSWYKMKSSPLLFILLLLFSCNNQDCSLEEQQLAQQTFNIALADWQHSLNFMDKSVIEPKQKLLDSLVQHNTCLEIDSSFIQQVDLVSAAYGAKAINRVKLQEANSVLERLIN